VAFGDPRPSGGYCVPDGEPRSRRGGNTVEDALRLMESMVVLLDRLQDALYDTAMLQNPRAFAALAKTVPKSITAGATSLGNAVLIYPNEAPVPVLLRARLQPDGGGTKAYLVLADSEEKASSFGKGAEWDYSEVPTVEIVVPPSTNVYAAAQSFTGVAQDLTVLVQAVPFRGRNAVNVGGVG